MTLKHSATVRPLGAERGDDKYSYKSADVFGRTVEIADINFLNEIDRLGSIKLLEAKKAQVADNDLPINLQSADLKEMADFIYDTDRLFFKIEDIYETLKSNRHQTQLAFGKKMSESGTASFSLLRKGVQVMKFLLGVDIYASIKDKQKAKDYFKSMDLERICKPVIEIPEDGRDDQLLELLKREGYENCISFNIHHQTLSAQLNQLAKSGEVLPNEQDNGIVVTLQPLAKITKRG